MSNDTENANGAFEPPTSAQDLPPTSSTEGWGDPTSSAAQPGWDGGGASPSPDTQHIGGGWGGASPSPDIQHTGGDWGGASPDAQQSGGENVAASGDDGWGGASPDANATASTPKHARAPRNPAFYASMAEQDAEDRTTTFGPRILDAGEQLAGSHLAARNMMRPYDPAVIHQRDFAPHERGCKMTATETNVPDRFELFLLGPGEKKVTVTPDTRIPSSALFTFHKEDHTLGNLLRARLLTSPHVTFAGYKVPHPLFPDFELRIQTDGETTPKDALVAACRDVVQDLGALGREFTKEWELKKMIGDGGQTGVN